MKIFIEENIRNIENQVDSYNLVAQQFESNIVSHRFNTLICWYRNFESKENYDFGKLRGRNFLGDKTELCKPQFLIATENGAIQGIVPLFLFKVFTRANRNERYILSFCPDSVIFFYNDIVVNPGKRPETIEKILEYLYNYIKKRKYALFMGHIPENSPNLHILKKLQKAYSKKDQLVESSCGMTVNKWRGGLFPWNINSFCKLLEKLNNKIEDKHTDLKNSIIEIIDDIVKKRNTLMLFKKSRDHYEEKIIEILNICGAFDDVSGLVNSIKNLFESKPILYPYLNLPKDEDELFKSLSKSKRYYYRRYLKKYKALGGQFETIQACDVTTKDIEDYIELHKLRWKNESAAINEQTIDFNLKLLESMAKFGNLILHFAKYNNERIASMACIDINNRREFFYAGRNRKYTNLRAGKLLVIYSIIDAIRKKIEIYDFGYGCDNYKFDFTNKYQILNSFMYTNGNTLNQTKLLFPYNEEIIIN